MSRENNRKFMNAYQKMLKDGTAFKEVDMRPEDPTDEFRKNESHLGEIEENIVEKKEDPNVDYSQFDNLMEQKMARLRNKSANSDGTKSTGIGINKEIQILKSKVAKLEEALMLVIETQTKLIG